MTLGCKHVNIIENLTFDTFELLLRDSRDHQILRPPQRADASRLFRHSRIEFELIGVYPRMGGVYGTKSINCVILLLKVSMLCMALVSAGMQQQTKLQNCSAPYTFTSFANQASVLVLCSWIVPGYCPNKREIFPGPLSQ